MDTDERRAFWQKVKLRPFMLFVTLSGLVGLLLLTLNPVHSMGFNLIHLGLALAAWSGATILGWKWNGLRMVMLGVPQLLMVLFLLPGKEIEVGELRDDYVKRMADFEGTQYSWGGESARGIDCSGLPRRAYRDALLSYGARHLSGSALRAWAEQWWFDASAKALGEGYRDYTELVGVEGTIREMNYERLMPGDLAVTNGGAHILAYAGDGKWIQADPGIGSVATLDGRKDKNGWFTVPVTTHRWSLLP
jgi:hypothetical protein